MMSIELGNRMAQDLHSSSICFPSLGHALADVPAEFGFPAAVGFRVVVKGRQRSLRASLLDEVYRIGREAIVNAYRHAQAESIETEIEFCSAGLRLAVRDDGCGIDLRRLHWGRRRHWGLQRMRERSEQIGARLRVLSRVALGTEIELCVPGRTAFEQG